MFEEVFETYCESEPSVLFFGFFILYECSSKIHANKQLTTFFVPFLEIKISNELINYKMKEPFFVL